MRIAIITGGVNPGHTRDAASLLEGPGSAGVSFMDLSCNDLSDIELCNMVIVFTSLESASEMQLSRLSSYLESDNRILFLMHEASIYDRKYTFFNHKMCVRFKRHWEYQGITIKKERGHALLDGVEPVFQLDDELYFFDEDKHKIMQDTNVLLSEIDTGMPVLFEKIIEKSNSYLYYLSIGHDDGALGDPNFKLIIKNLFSFARSISM